MPDRPAANIAAVPPRKLLLPETKEMVSVFEPFICLSTSGVALVCGADPCEAGAASISEWGVNGTTFLDGGSVFDFTPGMYNLKVRFLRS